MSLEVGVGIKVEALHDAETVAQRRGEQPCPRRGADQRERRQVDLDRAGTGAFADHDVELEVFERRVQDLFDDRAQPMDFVHEQQFIRLQVREQRREVAGAFQHRARCLLETDAKLVRDHVRERGLAETGRAEDQDMVERLATIARRLDEDLHLRLHRRLANIVDERLRPHRAVIDFLVALRCGGNHAVLFDRHRVRPACFSWPRRAAPGGSGLRS